MAILERKIIHEKATMCSHVSYPHFVLPLHKHVEFEIMLFTQGKGKQFVGEGVSDFQEGDIALIGSNVPHLHLCNTKLCSLKTCKTFPIIISYTIYCRKANMEFAFTKMACSPKCRK